MQESLGLLMIAALALPTPASAQMLDTAGRSLDAPRQVSLGLSIPLGGSADAPSKPQLELRATALNRRDMVERNFPGVSDSREHRRPEARIGLTLEDQPRLTVAGREVPASDERLGISTLGIVAIAVVAGAVVGGLLFIDAVNDASD